MITNTVSLELAKLGNWKRETKQTINQSYNANSDETLRQLPSHIVEAYCLRHLIGSRWQMKYYC